MLNAQRRHISPCKRAMWDQVATKCKCPITIRGTLNGHRVSLSTAKYLPPDKARDLEAARDLAMLWERIGKPVRPEESAVPERAAKAEPERPTVEMAVAAFMADGRDRSNSEATMYKRRSEFQKGLLGFCRAKGIRFLSEIGLNELREWRSTWEVESLSRQKRQGRVIGFLWFCERAGWYPRNHAADITKGLGKIQVKRVQTGYFQPDEYAKIIDTTHIYSDRPSVDKHNSIIIGGHRIRALTELMRWTGLRIRDAVTLEKNRLAQDPNTFMWSVMVYQKKTGDPVYCPIPPDVAELLLTVPASQKGNTNETYFFWTGQGNPKTIVTNWQRSYGKLFKLVALKEPDRKCCNNEFARMPVSLTASAQYYRTPRSAPNSHACP